MTLTRLINKYSRQFQAAKGARDLRQKKENLKKELRLLNLKKRSINHDTIRTENIDE